jgi:hypothetical protein
MAVATGDLAAKKTRNRELKNARTEEKWSDLEKSPRETQMAQLRCKNWFFFIEIKQDYN